MNRRRIVFPVLGAFGILIVVLGYQNFRSPPPIKEPLSSFAAGHEIRADVFGANFNISFYKRLGDVNFQANMKKLNLPFLRINGETHLLQFLFPSREAAQGIVAPDWDVLDAFTNLPQFFSGHLYLTVGGPPTWFDLSDSTDRFLYGQMVLKIAQHLKQIGIHVDYWQTINEPNGSGYAAYENMVSLLCSVDNATYKALKGFDSNILMGGPELNSLASSDDVAFLKEYGKCFPQAHFLSYHMYGPFYDDLSEGERTSDSILALMQGAAGVGAQTQSYRYEAQVVYETEFQDKIDIAAFLTEYNMDAAYLDLPKMITEPLQATVTGAVFDAVALTEAIKGGISSASIWEAYSESPSAVATPDTFGLLFGGIESGQIAYSFRPAAYLLMKMHESLPGSLVPSQVSGSSNVTSLASLSQDQKTLTVILVNYAPTAEATVAPSVLNSSNQYASIAAFANTYDRFEMSEVNPNGSSTSFSNSLSLANVELPANSVTLLSLHLVEVGHK